MAFTGTYSGTTLLYITQSGSDTDLSGLTSFTYYDSTAISTALGFTLGWTGQLIYFIDVPILVTGSLSWDSDEEMLVLSTSFPDSGSGFDYALRATGSSAIISIGIQQGTNPNGTLRYSDGVGLVVGFDFTDSNPLNYISNEGMLIDDAATVTVNGSEVQFASPLKIASNSGIVTFNETRIVDTNNQTFSKQTIRNESPSNILRLNNVEFDAKFQPQRFINLSGINTFSGTFKNSFIQPHRLESDPNIPGVGGKVALTNVIFGNNFNSYDWQLIGNSVTATNNQAVELTNVDIGTGVRPNQAVAGNVGHLAIFQNVKIIVQDANFNPIESCTVRIPTTDSGNRNNTLIGGQFIGNLDFTGTTYETYSDLTNASGETPQYKILTGRIWNDDLTSSTYTYDFYGKTQIVEEDLFDVQFASYLHNLATQEVAFKTANDIEVNQILTLDGSITETNKSIVDALTTINNSAEFYDRAKSELIDAYAGETETTVEKSGNQTNARAYNVTIDETASSAYDLTGNTITIKTSMFIGDITTTGTITLLNGATFIGTFTDTAGTTTITQLTLTGLKTNTEVRVYQAGTTTEIDGVENSGTTFTTTTSESSVDIVVHALGYEYQRLNGVDTSQNLTLPISQRTDRNYSNP